MRLGKTTFLLPWIAAIFFFSCQKDESINIAFIGLLSGNNQVSGSQTIQSISLAIEEFNADGGVGGLPVSLTLADANTESVPDLIRDLIEIRQIIAAIGPERSSTAIDILEAVTEFELPIISPSASNSRLTLESPYFFRTTPSDTVQAQVLSHYIFENMNIKNVSIINSDDDYSLPLSQYFKEYYQKLGGKVDYVGNMHSGSQDASSHLDQLLKINTSTLLLPLNYLEASVVLHQIRQRKLPFQVIGTDSFSLPQLINRFGSQADNVIYSTPPQRGVGIENEKIENFESRYYQRFNEMPDSFAYNSYDATKILLQAISRTMIKQKTFNRQQLRDEISLTQDFQGVSGIISFDENGDIHRGIEIVRIEKSFRKKLGIYNVNAGKLFKIR